MNQRGERRLRPGQAPRLRLLKQFPERGRQVSARPDHTPAGADEGSWQIGPCGARTIEKVSVPDNPAASRVLGEPGADNAVRVVIVDDSLIVHHLSVDEVSRIAGQHVEPNHIDPYIR